MPADQIKKGFEQIFMSETAVRLRLNYSAVFSNTLQDLWLLKLSLPRNSWGGTFSGSTLVETKTGNLIAATPDVDPIISEFGAALLPIRFTVRFIEFVNQKYYLFQIVPPGERLRYAVEIYKRLNNYSLMEVDPNEAKAREVLVFYLNSQTFLIHQSNLQSLIAAGENMNPDFLNRLAKVNYFVGKVRKQLTAAEAKSFLDLCRERIEKHLDEMFLQLTAKAAGETPKTENATLAAGLKAVTAEMLMQINPALPKSRAEDLAPYLNQAIAEAQISTLVAEAMFLAQLLHEMGTKNDLNEGGGKKMYEGKVYDYFFLLYDKDSPNPKRAKLAIKNGNTTAGDGAKYHGRGYIQLTWKNNYTNAGAYLGLDLVNNPDLANDPKNSVRIAAWFWRFGNGNLNSIATEDTAAKFNTVTERINGGLTHIAERRALYANAKKVLGVK